MKKEENYIAINRQSWNNRVQSHMNSDFYDLEGFLQGNTSLNSIELQLLGEIKNKHILHLQCHFGQDSLSLGRLGAHVTGVDLSDKAIESAIELANKTKIDANFICSDIYELPKCLDKQFDIVFTSYGTISWLPNLDKWAKIVAKYLKPDGKFVFVEFHPVVWMFDDDFQKIAYHYFNKEVIIETETGSYADKTSDLTQEYVMWNHSISDVVNNLVKNGLEINSLDEFDYSPYNCFNKTEEFKPNKFRIKHLDNKIPMVYAIVAIKKKWS